MNKLTTTIALLLVLSCNVFAQHEFEYVFDSIQNESPCILFNDIIELDNGDFFISGRDLAFAQAIYFCRFSPNGELIKEKRFGDLLLPDYQNFCSDNFRVLTNDNGGFYLFYTYNPQLNPSLLGHEPNIFDAKLVMSELNADFDILHSKEMTFSIDTVDWKNLLSQTDAYYPRIIIGTVLEDEGNGFVLCCEKLPTHYPYNTHLPDHGEDSTIFIKTDYDFNVLKSESYGHERCNRFIHRNHLIYDAEYDKYLYYTSISHIGFYVSHFDSDFNFTGEKTLAGTTGQGAHCMVLRDEVYDMAGLTLKRTASHTTIIGAGTSQHHLINNNIESYYAASCLEVDDNAHLVDSMVFAHSDIEDPRQRTSVPMDRSVDWIEEDRIFFGATPSAVASTAYFLKKFQYFILRLLDRNLNTINEVYYDMGKDSTALWINTLKATSDGGCIIAGQFWNYVEEPNNNFTRAFHSVVKKFPPEAFDGIDEAHDNGLKVAVAFPNPGNNQLNIRTTLPDSHIEVYDINGKLIHNVLITDLITSINTEKWPSGTYFWKVISDNNEAESGKWVK